MQKNIVFIFMTMKPQSFSHTVVVSGFIFDNNFNLLSLTWPKLNVLQALNLANDMINYPELVFHTFVDMLRKKMSSNNFLEL